MKILVCDYSFDNDEYKFQKSIFQREIPECNVEKYVYSGNKQELIKQLESADYLLTSFVPVDGEAMQRAQLLKLISITATGYATVDCEAASKLGIGVYNVNDYCTEEVSVHAISMILAMMRGLKKHDCHISRDLEWKSQYVEDVLIPSKTNAVIYGYGKIGKRTAVSLQQLGMKVYVVSAHAQKKELESLGLHKIREDEVGKIADVICNHQSATGLPVHFFDKHWFASLERSPIFINVGRGINVDETALLEAIELGNVRGAGLDVFESEKPDLQNNPFRNRDNVMLTPHSAFYSKWSMETLLTKACMNIVDHYKGANDSEKNCIVKAMR